MGKHYTLGFKRVYSTRSCVICESKFEPQTSSQRTCHRLECKATLTKQRERVREDKLLVHLDPAIVKPNSRKKLLSQIKSRKYKIKDEFTTPSVDSPTGRVYIGVAKKPLIQIKNGFGYQGVLLQTDNRMFVQCHVCGKWLRRLSQQHLDKHMMTQVDYKKKFGLYEDKGLVCDALSYSQEKNARKVWANNREEMIKHLQTAKALQKNKHKKQIGVAQHDNKYGYCEKQLGFRLVEYIKAYKMLPTRSHKGEGSRISKALYRRYQSVNKGFEHYKLPAMYRTGSRVELVAPNKKQMFFNYNKDYNRERIYEWMIDNTPVLASEINIFKD